jgi:hypothetical protein
MAINNYKHNLEEPLVVKDLQITGTRVDNQNTLVFTKSIQLSADNTSGGGLILSDDGDFVDLNTGFGAFRFTSGISVYSASRGGSPVINLESGGNINFVNNSGTTTRGIIGLCGDSDYWFYGGGATASNAGFAQISTGDDGNEPIYVRQYVGDPRAGTLQRTLTLLNESGNTIIPGSTRIGSATSRSSSGLTVGFSNNSTYVPNTDVGDGYRMLSLVNESTTTNAMSVLGFRINPDSGTANAMLDLRFVQTGATSTSALHYTFNHGGSFVDRFTILSSGSVGIGTTNPSSQLHITGQFQSTQANSTTTGGGQIYLNGSVGNRIDFNQNGVAAPSFTTRSAGTKIVLYPTSAPSTQVDYAFGIDANTLWSSVFNSAASFKWYAGTTNIATLFGTGELLLGTTTLTGTASQRLQVTGGAYVSGNLGIGSTNPGSKLAVIGDAYVSGVVTATSFRGDGSQLSGITASSGIATSVIGGIGSITQLQVTGISTFTNGPVLVGRTSATGTASQLLQVESGAYFSGNIGIGTTNPSGSGTVQIDVVRAGANIFARNTSTTGSAGIFAADADYFTSFRATYISKFATGATGNIFSSIPNADLGILAFQNTTNGLIYTNGGSPLIFGTLSTEAMRIDASQRVGIGTNNPSHTLHVQGNARITGAFRDSTNQPGVAGQILQSTNTGTTWVTASSVPAGGRFDTSIDSAIYVQPTGTLDIVGVGTTTTQITTLPSGTNEYVIHSMHVTNVSNGDAEITAGFAINGRRVSTTGSLGSAGIATFTVSSASGILVGMAVSGTSFQSSSYVTSVDGTAVSVSKPMTGSTSGTVVFTPVSKVASRLPVPVGSAVELLKQPMVLNALDSIVLQSTGVGTGIGSTSTATISQTANSNILTVTAGAAITNFIASGMLIEGTGTNTGIQTNTFVGVGYTPGSLLVPMTRPARSTLASQILSFTEVALPQDGALQVAITYQSSLTDFSYQNGTGTVAALSPTVTSVSSGLSTIPVAYYSTGNTYQSVVQSIRVTNISDGTIYPGGDYPVSVGIGNSDTIFSWLAYNMVIPRNSSIELCESPKRIGIGQSIFAFTNTPYAIEIQVTGKQKTT